MGPLNKKDAELNLVFSIKVNDFDYAVFVNSGTQSFGCGREGHLVRTCPEKTPGKRAEPAEVTAGTSTNVETEKQRVANVENHIQSVTNVEGKKRNVENAKQCGESPKKASQSVEMLKMKSCVVKILKIQFWVLKMKGRVNVLFRRRGIMHSKSQQRVMRLGPSLLHQRNAGTVRKG